MLLGMNQHSLHPKKSLSPQRLVISGVSVALPNLFFSNTLNKNSVTTLYMLAKALENIRLLSSFSLSLVNKSGEILSSVILSTSSTFLISFKMKSRGKVEQARVCLNQLQLSLIKTLNFIKAKFILLKLLPFHVPRQFWGVTTLSIMMKSWKAKNYFSYLPFIKRVLQHTLYHLRAVFHFYLTSLVWSNIPDKIAFHKKVALLVKNLQFILL